MPWQRLRVRACGTVDWSGVEWTGHGQIPPSPHLILRPLPPTVGPKGDEQASRQTRPDAACHPRQCKPSPDLDRVCVDPDTAAIRICDAGPRWAADLSGWTHPDGRAWDGSPRWRWPER
jgi:hypothetical protein